LEGIPLAIELAAARVRALSVEEIEAHLSDRFRLLTGGSRAALPRQQTLRALVDWSYDLLSEAERVLLRRLSVCAGGWTLEAAEAIGAGAEGRDEVMELLVRLADKSLISVDEHDGVSRYRFLETIRQYGVEKLGEQQEAVAARDRHGDFYLRVAEAAAQHLERAEQAIWLKHLEADHDNLRAAMRWAIERGDVERSLRFAGGAQPRAGHSGEPGRPRPRGGSARTEGQNGAAAGSGGR
jgi:predicted ATPase